MFQKVNEWLADRSDRFAHGNHPDQGPTGAYYASSEAEQAYGGMRGEQPVNGVAEDRYSAGEDDPYGGRVPYRSQKDMQNEAELLRQQAEEQARSRQAAAQQQQTQQFGRQQPQPPAQTQAAQNAPNVLQFPGMIRGPEGNLYAHVEYIVLLRNRNECTKVIEYIKSNASVFLNMEFIANDSERQRCVDMLSGAAYTLGCRLNKISQRGIDLISSPSVYVVVDPAMQKYTAPEAQGYRAGSYGSYSAYGTSTAAGYGYPQQQAQQNAAYHYAAQPNAGYAAAQGYAGAYATQATPQYASQQTGYMAQPGAYAAQPNAGFAQQRRYAAQPDAGYGAPQHAAGYAAQPNAGYSAQPAGGYAAQPNAYRTPRAAAGYAAQHGYHAQPNAGYNAQPDAGYSAQRRDPQPVDPGQAAWQDGAQPGDGQNETGYNAQRDMRFSANAPTAGYQVKHNPETPAEETDQEASQAPAENKTGAFNMRGAFWKGYENVSGE